MQRPSRRWHARRGAAAILGLVSFFVAGSRGEEPRPTAPPTWRGTTRGSRRRTASTGPSCRWSSPRSRPSRTRPGCRNPIDAFVLAQLEAQGWTPAPPAEASALLRRVSLDLIGLPPTPEERRAFLDDPSPDALDRRVDELLARPSYGERWGRHWLDLVRFAETNGYERDATKPNAWRYRDYVIRAFNDDKPFDRFLQEQLAGDELPDASDETLVATGYYRLGPWDDEPADPKQDRFDQLDDMVGTTSEVFLGLTLACARCHNHKFEPLSALDYYRMVAIFNPLERPVNGRTERDLPSGSPSQVAAEAERDRRIEAISRRIAERRASWRSSYLQSGRSTLPAEAVEAFRVEPGRRTEAQKKLANDHKKALESELAATLPEGGQEGDRRRRGGDRTAPRRHARPASRLLPARADAESARRPTCSSGARRRPPAPRSSRASPRSWSPRSPPSRARRPPRPRPPAGDACAGALALPPRAPADGARDRQPGLAGTLRRGDRAHPQRLRHDGRPPDASRAARLAGPPVRRGGLVDQEAAPADPGEQHLPDGQARRPRVRRGRPRSPPPLAGALPTAGRRGDPRLDARRRRQPRPGHVRPERLSVHPQGGARGAQRPGQGLEAVRRAGRLQAARSTPS